MAKGEDLRRVGQAVAARRGKLGMTQQALAEAAGIDTKTLYSLEAGARWPIARSRVAISRALGWEGDALADLAAGIPPGQADAEAPAPRPALAPVPAPGPADQFRPTPGVAAFAREYGVDPDNPSDPYLLPVRQEIADATVRYGMTATGAQVFHGQPWSDSEARAWDNPDITRPDKELLIAATRADRARTEAARNRRGRAGLALVAPARG